MPYQPLNLVAEAMSPNVILVKWDAPQEADSIKSYELYFNDSHFRQNGRVSIDPPVQNYRLINLTPDTIYHIQVNMAVYLFHLLASYSCLYVLMNEIVFESSLTLPDAFV